MSRWISLVLFLLFCRAAFPADKFNGVGRAATAPEIAAWDIDVRPDFKGLPAGSGSVQQGEELWEAKCASCHGTFGESNAVFAPISGGVTPQDIERGRVAALARPGEQRTMLMKLSQISTLWDYINRAMPWNAPKTLAPNEVYALTAYLLNLGRIVPEDFQLNERNIAEVQQRLPNRDGLMRMTGMWHASGRGDVRNVACMHDCPAKGDITSQLPDQARGTHGDLALQNRLIGPTRGARLAIALPANADKIKPLAEKSGCLGCHSAKQRLVGPSFAEIASRYRTDAGAEPRLAANVKAGSQGVWGNVPMPPHPRIEESEARALVRWILTSD
ncbi:MAG: c-type cytochrome [Betaproteobacteria bacterium]